MGIFSHEAAAVDPKTNIIYLTEDDTNGLIYRYLPSGILKLHVMVTIIKLSGEKNRSFNNTK